MVSKSKVAEIMLFCLANGEGQTKEKFGLSDETFNRYKREYKKQYGEIDNLLAIRERFSSEELDHIAKGERPIPHNGIEHSFTGTKLKIGIISDMHFGSIYTDPTMTEKALEVFETEKVDIIACPGDLVEGMMGRPGDIYELSHIGYKAQRDETVRVLGKKNPNTPLFAISGNHDCLDAETELLTQRGWITYKEISKADKVLSYDPSCNKARWDSINEIIVKKADSPLVQVETQRFSLTATKNHRVLCRGRQGNKLTDWKYIPASTLEGTAVFQVASSLGKKDYDISDDMLRLVAWMLTDGCIRREKETQTGSYTIYQSKDITGITAILDSLGMNYSLRERQRNIKIVCGKVLKKPPMSEKAIRLYAESAKRLKEYLFDKAHIPAWLMDLSDRQFEVFIHEVKMANGSLSKTTGCAIYGRKDFLDALQIMCILHNQRAAVVKDTRGCWKMNLAPLQNTLELRGIKATELDYHGDVWCLSVPLTNFMIRRDGKAHFTGNCSYNSKHGVGANIVEDIISALPNAHYLGHDEGDIHIAGIIIRLFHGGDGGSYALSYRGQKIIEAISGGTKPNLLIAGHSHKSIYLFNRNIHYIEAGTLQTQSSWMRGKKLAAHVGFSIADLTVADGSIKSLSYTWYPFYK